MIRGLSREQKELLEAVGQDAELLRLQRLTTYKLRRFQPVDLAVMARYLGFAVPTEHGGRGADTVTQGLVLAKLAEGNAALALWLAMHWFALNEIARAADPDTQARLFRMALTQPFCAAISEPQTTGQDINSFKPKLTAEFADGKWVLNGRKERVTGYPQSEGLVLFALDKANDRTICLAIPTGLPGMTPGNEWDEVDFLQPSNTVSVTFKDVKVDEDAFLYVVEDFLTEILFVHGARSLAYMVVYLGVLAQLFAETAKILKTPRPGQERANSYQNAVAAEMGECYRQIYSAALCLVDALAAYDDHDPQTPMLVLQAKVGIGRAADFCERTFREEGGLKWRTNPEIMQDRSDLSVASLMPPKSRMALTALGHMVLEQDPADGF